MIEIASELGRKQYLGSGATVSDGNSNKVDLGGAGNGGLVDGIRKSGHVDSGV